MSWLGALSRRRPALLPPREAYARWAPSYPREAANELMRLDEREVLRLLPVVAGRTVLDVGCGSGRYLAHLSRLGARVVGLDPVPAMLARAGDAPVACAALPRLPVRDAAFDAVVCALVVGHVAHLGAALAEMARVLRPGGTLVYTDLHPDGASRGWQRTFRGDDGRPYAVRHVVHARPEHEAACRWAGLAVDEVVDACVELPGPLSGQRALLAVRAHRPMADA